MLKNALCFCLLSGLVSVAWSDEPVPPRVSAVVKQRVDPKLLQEAFALQEFQGEAPESSAALLDDLKKLADKLKKNGDTEASDLIQRFISEHQRLANQLQNRAISFHDRQYLVLKVVEVNLDRLPADSILLKNSMMIPGKSCAESSKICELELERLIQNKDARALIEPALRVRSDGAVHHHPAEEFPIPIKNGTVTLNFREFGILIEALPTSISEQKIRLQSTCEFAQKNGIENGTTHTKIQENFEMNLGESAVQCSATLPSIHQKWFVIYKFLPRS